jgi:cysteine desulfurase
VQSLQKVFIEHLTEKIPEVVINGSRKHRLPNNVHITIPGQDNERLMMELDERGILCAVGSACSASNEEPSHVLKAMGLSDAEAQSSLRFTMGIETTEADVLRVVDTLAELVS